MPSRGTSPVDKEHASRLIEAGMLAGMTDLEIAHRLRCRSASTVRKIRRKLDLLPDLTRQARAALRSIAKHVAHIPLELRIRALQVVILADQ